MIFHARDCRGGKGERDITFKTYLHLYDRFPITMNALLEFFPYYGRWKDLNTIFTMTKG